MKHVYIVNFEIHQNCQIKDYVYICTAQNAKEACKTARYFWKGDGHQFHIHAVRSRSGDPEKAGVVDWKGRKHSGLDVFDKYICINFKTWRYKASNGQYVYPLMQA